MANVQTLVPWLPQQFLDNNGNPASGYRLFSYAAGTSTKLNLVTTATFAGTEHSNPVVLDSAGFPPSPLFAVPNSYKFVLAPPGSDDPPTTTVWTRDNIYPAPPFNVDLDIVGVAGEAITANDWVYCSAGDGGRTGGRYYKTDADLDYASTTARIVGIAMTAATQAAASFTVRRMGLVTGLTGLTAGSLYYLSGTAGGITTTAPANTRRVGLADSTTSLVIAAEIVEPNKGYIPLDFAIAREVTAGNVIPAIASPASGGLLASDTTPAFERVNAATDKALRINWVAGNSDEITWCFAYPPDWDDLSNVEVHLMAASAGATNSPVIAVNYFEGVGDANAGSNTAAVTGTTPADYSVTITAANIGAHPNFASVSLIPAAHATDALRLYGAWIEYTKLLKSS